SGLDCRNGACGVCKPRFTTCGGTPDCCAGLTCRAGQCNCTDNNSGCSSDGDCCSGNCQSLVCTCAPRGHVCTNTSQCCSGMSCVGGECTYDVCQPSTFALCVDPMDCCGGGCEGGTCCSQLGIACQDNGTCCGTNVCGTSS